MNFNTNYFALQNRGKDPNGEAKREQTESPSPEEKKEVTASNPPARESGNVVSSDYKVPPPVFIKPKTKLLPLTVKGTSRTPEVNFTPATSTFSVTGRSIPEDSVAFYQTLNDWVGRMEEQYEFEKPACFVFELEYFNTSSSKCLLDLFKNINRLHLTGKPVSILWRYDEDDEDLMETGEDYRDLLDLPFELESVEY